MSDDTSALSSYKESITSLNDSLRPSSSTPTSPPAIVGAAKSNFHSLSHSEIFTPSRTTSLKDKVVIVTGSASGFGRGYAVQMARLGAKVVLSDVDVRGCEKVVEEIKRAGGVASAYGEVCDVAKWEHQVAMFNFAQKLYGRIDIVVANAGVGEVGHFLEDHLDQNGDLKPPNLKTLSINLIGAAYTVKLAFHHLRKNSVVEGSRGAIVFIGSMASMTGLPGAGNYTMAKHGILGLFRSTFHDAQVESISSNIILPWFCSTGIIEPVVRVALLGLPLATVEDVVAAMVYASSPSDDISRKSGGLSLVVDASGILALPFEAFAPGPEGYYVEFGKRATYAIQLGQTVREIAFISRMFVGKVMGAKGVQYTLSMGVLILAVASATRKLRK